MDCTSSAPFLLLYEPVLSKKLQNIHKSSENGSIYESPGAAAGMREAWGVLCRRQKITASVSKCKWDKWLRSICCGGPRLSILCRVRDVSSAPFTPSPHCFDALIRASEGWSRRRMKTLMLALKDRNCAVCWDTRGMGFSSTRYCCLLSRWIHHGPEKKLCSCALAGLEESNAGPLRPVSMTPTKTVKSYFLHLDQAILLNREAQYYKIYFNNDKNKSCCGKDVFF